MNQCIQCKTEIKEGHKVCMACVNENQVKANWNLGTISKNIAEIKFLLERIANALEKK